MLEGGLTLSPHDIASREPQLVQDVNVQACTVEAATEGPLRRYRAFFMGIADLWLVGASCFVAYLLRFHSSTLARVLPFREAIPDPVVYLVISVIITATWIFLMSKEGVYRNSLCSMRPLSHEFRVVLGAGVRVLAVAMVTSFLFRMLDISRIFLLMEFGLAVVLLLTLRLLLSNARKWSGARDLLCERFALVGKSRPSVQILQRLDALGPLANVIGMISFSPNDSVDVTRCENLPILGDINNIERIIKDHGVTGVIFASMGYDFDAYPELSETLIRAINSCESQGIPFCMIPDALNVAVRRSQVGSCCGFPVIELRDAVAHPLYGIAKRIIDVVVAVTALVVGLPIWLTIAAVIKLTSKGPILYVQKRVGRNGYVFPMYKFRTMVEDAASRLGELVNIDTLPEPVFKIRNDPRVTPVGRFLRRFGLDEVPQLFNVLIGDMSLIGPRPEQLELVQRYDEWQRRRLKARPGITGYQQVMSRGETSLDRRINYDLYYLKYQSLFLDMLILWKTFVVIVRGEGIT